MRFATVILVASLLSCSHMQEMHQKYDCNFDSAYQKGMNDARQSKNMDETIAYGCTEDKLADVQRGYRDGYEKGLKLSKTPVVNIHVGQSETVIARNTPAPKVECIERYGKRVCGYGCLDVLGDVYCGEAPGMKCLESGGQVACGYNCIAKYGKMACGSKSYHRCSAYAGDIRCGVNCRAEFGRLVCDEFAPEQFGLR